MFTIHESQSIAVHIVCIHFFFRLINILNHVLFSLSLSIERVFRCFSFIFSE